MFDLESIVRKNIQVLKPYSSARTEFKGKATVFLDANESPFEHELSLNRYPDPLQWKLKRKLSKIKGVKPEQIFLGNGSDEAIDLIIRIFCEPGEDAVQIFPPTYGMYQVSADINHVMTIKTNLTADFELPESIAWPKVSFICSPNNPTGRLISRDRIMELTNQAGGIIVVDEAYIDFCQEKTILTWLDEMPNLIVLQTFSKAWGLAGARLGVAYASQEIIELMNKVKPPYNVNELTIQKGLEALSKVDQVKERIAYLIKQRTFLSEELAHISIIKKVYPSDANFILIQVDDAKGLYQKLLDQGIVVRDRSGMINLENCLRITVGTKEENKRLLKAIKNIE